MMAIIIADCSQVHHSDVIYDFDACSVSQQLFVSVWGGNEK